MRKLSKKKFLASLATCLFGIILIGACNNDYSSEYTKGVLDERAKHRLRDAKEREWNKIRTEFPCNEENQGIVWKPTFVEGNWMCARLFVSHYDNYHKPTIEPEWKWVRIDRSREKLGLDYFRY